MECEYSGKMRILVQVQVPVPLRTLLPTGTIVRIILDFKQNVL